jgi:N-acetylglucosaminyl-diphospho-decaprenol L-rhamnosyltransferase
MTARRRPLLSILMLMHNDGKYLGECLDSIERNVSCSFEVVLVDNASSEPVSEDVRGRYPWLQVIRSDVNLGFNAGNNLAASHASGEYILLLNIDTVLLTDVAASVRLLDSDPVVGVVGAQAYGPAKQLRPSAGHFPRAWRLWVVRSLWMKPRVPYGSKEWDAFFVDWVEGSFLMTRLRNWKEIGGFEGKYFFFGNDLNFCREASDRGLAVVQCTAVKYIHYCGFGTNRLGHLYAGFREYHRKFSSPLEQYLAEFVLRSGLLVRIAVYGLWYVLTGRSAAGEKLRRFSDLRKQWSQLTP